MPPLDAASCAEQIVNRLKSFNEEITEEQEEFMVEAWIEILTPLFDHIKANAGVTTSTVVSSGSSAGTWAGTGTIS